MPHFKILFSCLFLLSLASLSSCIEDTSKTGGELKLRSEGGPLEIVVVMDSSTWQGSVGEALRNVYEEALPGLPRGERRFNLLAIGPRDFNRFLRRHHNVIFATILNDNSRGGRLMKSFFTETTLKSLKDDGKKFMLGKKDEFALGQKVLYLFGNTPRELVQKLAANEDRLREYFYQAERARVQSRILGEGRFVNEPLSREISEETGLSMRVPEGFAKAKTDSNFYWVRDIGKPYDRNITVSYGKYSSQEMFDPEFIVKWRNHFGYKSMNDTTLNQSYMNTQDDAYPVESRQVKINGQFAMEYRGLWKLKNNTRGGPFLGYAMVDEKTNRFYYIESFVYAPTERHRSVMFELESVLHTLRLKGQKKGK